MTMNRRKFVAAGLAGLSAAALTPVSSVGQAKYPTRPVRLVVAFSAGGVNDVVARQWAGQMQEPLGTVYVHNMPGGGGTVGALEVVRAEPDGYNLFLGSTSTLVINPFITPQLSYKPSDFEAISILCLSPVVVAVHPSVPAKNLKEFIAYAKANSGKLSYGSAGATSMSHLGGELFKQLAGINMVHIPYKGAGPGINDLMSGHIPVMSPNITTNLIALHEAGKIRILSVHSDKRLTALPDVPTSIEQGMPSNMIAELFLGIYAPAKTPKEIIDRVADATRSVVQKEAYRKMLIASGFEPIADSGPEQARQYLVEQTKQWRPVLESVDLGKGK